MIKIEKGIPLIPIKKGRCAAAVKYPFADMQINDSFLIKKNLSTMVELRSKQANNIRSSVTHCLQKYNKKHKPIQITTRTLDEGIRVWRIK